MDDNRFAWDSFVTTPAWHTLDTGISVRFDAAGVLQIWTNTPEGTGDTMVSFHPRIAEALREWLNHPTD